MKSKCCSHCGTELIIDKNWTKANAKKKYYLCRRCLSKHRKAYYRANKAKILFYDKKYRTANKEYIANRISAWRKANKEHLAGYERARRHANEGSYVDYILKWRYGITLADYDEMLEVQGNGCAICGKTPEENGQRLSVDHNHETGEVRGLLCRGCNSAIGHFKDSPERCLAAARYLQEHG